MTSRLFKGLSWHPSPALPTPCWVWLWGSWPRTWRGSFWFQASRDSIALAFLFHLEHPFLTARGAFHGLAQKPCPWDLLGHPVVKNPCFHCGSMGLITNQELRSHMSHDVEKKKRRLCPQRYPFQCSQEEHSFLWACLVLCADLELPLSYWCTQLPPPWGQELILIDLLLCQVFNACFLNVCAKNGGLLTSTLPQVDTLGSYAGYLGCANHKLHHQ